jgi:hypothetical protein
LILFVILKLGDFYNFSELVSSNYLFVFCANIFEKKREILKIKMASWYATRIARALSLLPIIFLMQKIQKVLQADRKNTLFLNNTPKELIMTTFLNQ